MDTPGQERKQSSNASAPPHPDEWNFDKLTDSELVACCYWEYARESQFICSTLQRHAKYLAGVLPNTTEEVEEIQRNEEKLFGLGYALEIFVPGAFSDQQPERPPSIGDLDKPWQALDPTERKTRAIIPTVTESQGIVPIRLSPYPCSERIARAWDKMYERSLGEGKPVPRFSFRHGPIQVNGVQSARHFWSGKRETLLIDIEWGHFSNDEIAEYFRKWVSGARPKHFPNPKKTGRTRKHDRRAALRDLGVMRLLNFCTVAGMKARCPDAAKHFGGWESKHWSAARKRALRNFRSLFPFLPEGELPLHATTKGGRGKL
ncbi:MAG: hypothetical protein ABSG14_10900 [Verrucomicrobiia bacterium]